MLMKEVSILTKAAFTIYYFQLTQQPFLQFLLIYSSARYKQLC